MDAMELIEARHSVRQYKEQPIEAEKRSVLDALCEKCNAESGLHMQIIYDEPKCFHSIMAHYGKFRGVTSYIAIVGKKGADLEEKAGYYGEQLVLKAQELGLNACWVALTHGKSAAKVARGEKLAVIISLGYGETQGVAHKSRPLPELSRATGSVPEWYERGVRAAQLAPTAVNQQKFLISLEGDAVTITAPSGAYTKMDLGIVKYHFELVSGHKVN